MGDRRTPKNENERPKSSSPLDSAKKTAGRLMREASILFGFSSTVASYKNDVTEETPLLGASMESTRADSFDVDDSKGARKKISPKTQFPKMNSRKKTAGGERDEGETSQKLSGSTFLANQTKLSRIMKPGKLVPQPKGSSLPPQPYVGNKAIKPERGTPYSDFHELTYVNGKVVFGASGKVYPNPRRGSPFSDFHELTYVDGKVVFKKD